MPRRPDPNGNDVEYEIRLEILLAEVDSSLSFLSVEFVVCTALLVFNSDVLALAPVAAIALFASVVFFLYGGLSFAAAGGRLARGTDHRKREEGIATTSRSIEIGNLLSEWFGLYFLIFALPAVVMVATAQADRLARGDNRGPNSIVGVACLIVDLLGYASYVFSRSDMLHRFTKMDVPWERRCRAAAHLGFGAFLTLHWWGVGWSHPVAQIVFGSLFVALAIGCAAVHARRGEFGRGP